MEILKKQPTVKAPADWFTGDVWFDVIYAGQEPSRARLNLVRFSPCARTTGTPTPSARPCTSSPASP